MPLTLTLRALAQRLLPAIAIGIAVSFAFVALFTSALHDPRPHDLKVAVVGSPALASQLQRQLDQALPGGLRVASFGNEPAARSALVEQRLDGVLVPAGARPRLLLAGASGSNASEVVRAAFGAAAGAAGQRLRVADLVPLPRHDSRGLSAFFVVAGTTIGSLAFSAVLFFLGGHAGHAPLRLRLLLIGAFASASGLVVALDTRFVADGLSDAFWGVAGIVALLAAAVALITTAVVRWIGAPGIGLCVLAFMFFSLPAVGGPVGPEFVPGFYGAIAPILPSDAALRALKGAAYFDGGGTATPIAVLLAWIAAAVVLQSAAHLLRRRPPLPPVVGLPLQLVGAGRA